MRGVRHKVSLNWNTAYAVLGYGKNAWNNGIVPAASDVLRNELNLEQKAEVLLGRHHCTYSVAKLFARGQHCTRSERARGAYSDGAVLRLVLGGPAPGHPGCVHRARTHRNKAEQGTPIGNLQDGV